MGNSQIRVHEGLETLRQQLPLARRGIDTLGRSLTEAVTVTGYHRKALIRRWPLNDSSAAAAATSR